MATVNKQTIVAVFGQVATHYEQHADLQRRSADVLLAMLPQRKCIRVLNAGCGSGQTSRHWRERHAQVTALDLSPLMLVQVRQKDATDHYLAGDIESLPLVTTTFDLAWSNLAVQWCGNLSTVLHELYRVVRPEGMVAFTTLVQGLLPELHQAWQVMSECLHADRFLPPDEIEQSPNSVHCQYRIQSIAL